MPRPRKVATLLLVALGICPKSLWNFSEVEGRIPLKDLKVGEEVDGRVKGRYRSMGWFVDIGAIKDAFMEFEECCEGFPPNKMFTWRNGDSLTVRILELDDDRVYLTKRGGSLERPPRFRQSPSVKDVEAYRDVDANELIDASICGMSPNGIWLRLPSRAGDEGQDFRTLLRAEHCKESVKSTASLGMTVPVRVTGIDQEKNQVLVTMLNPEETAES